MAEVSERDREALEALRPFMAPLPPTATMLILEAIAQARAEEREHTLDLWYLAAGLHDDDCWFGDRRSAPERLERAGNAMGWPGNTRTYFRDVVGREPVEAAIRARGEK